MSSRLLRCVCVGVAEDGIADVAGKLSSSRIGNNGMCSSVELPAFG